MKDFNLVLPYVRSLAAFILYLRFGREQDICYRNAEVFLTQLKSDLEEQKRGKKA